MPLVRKPSGAPKPQPEIGADPRRGSDEERWAAARALTTAQDVPVLVEALQAGQSPRVHEAILTSLSRIATPEAAAAVVAGVRSDEAWVRTAALDALKAMPSATAVHLPGLLADTDPDVRLLATELARGLPAAEATALLCALLEHETQSNVCGAAIEVLTEVGTVDALPALEACARRFQADSFVSFAARVAMGRLGADPGAPRG